MKQLRSKRMQPVAHHAEQKEQDAVRIFVEAQKALQASEQQLQQLLTYRGEYKQQLADQQRQSISMRRMRDYQLFIDNLGTTIDSAYMDVELKKKICDEKKQLWLACRSRSHALGSVVEKYQLEEYRDRERLEQKEQDEHAQRIFQGISLKSEK
ncbi:MAG: flagellar export protein FliJ [Gammaproteobacteria bacterium]|nr:flagellar export protein FliJ [Gammaproteobacteria bacterium]MCW8909704.1 flagellar export protein FliJ [Gammaproteobacteria bacterium]MCW9005894.1 flagellar export protein FliJ [Gammaproteobacteria bacterium]